MRKPKGIASNLHFLIREVESQVSNLQTFFVTLSPAIAQQIQDRSGYTYNLKTRIHNSFINHIANDKQADVLLLRSYEAIATELENISILSREGIQQITRLNKNKINYKPFTATLESVNKAIGIIETALNDKNTPLALNIYQIREQISLTCNKQINKYSKRLKGQKQNQDIITALFVTCSVEQMGDALLKISETIISRNLGQSIDIERYHSMLATVEKFSDGEKPVPLQVKQIAETRSGSAISALKVNDGDDPQLAIFKDGEKRKLNEEHAGVKSWHKIYPGLAPKILSYKKRGKSASLLIEHLAGLTFEQILLYESPLLLKKTLKGLAKTLDSVWNETRVNDKVSAGYLEQLNHRLDDIYTIHPEFRTSKKSLCGLRILSFDELIKKAQQHEKSIKAPFSVYIHGDFNIDNIIYDPLEKRINFIDLHRSRYMDYVQDVSVFMVSNYRLQSLDTLLRQRINEVICIFYSNVAKYAKKSGDDTFEIRLALGLARSFATSTRFILDKTLARDMMLRARYLLEQINATEIKKVNNFKIPIKEIFVG